MTRLTEKYKEPYKTQDGKEFDNELDLIKHVHGFEGRQTINHQLDQDERDSRWLSRKKAHVNHAR